MGLWSTIKGWLNIGGVDVKLWKYSEPLKRSNPVITGAVLLKTKSEKTVLSLEVKVVEEVTTGSGEDKKTVTNILGKYKVPDMGKGLGYPLVLKPGENKEEPFTLNVALTQRLQDYGGVVGGLGKLAAFASGETVEFYLMATADVQGTPFDPTHKVKLSIAN